MTKRISSNITKSSKKKQWTCKKCGKKGIVGEYTQSLICGDCGNVISEFKQVEIITEPWIGKQEEIMESDK